MKKSVRITIGSSCGNHLGVDERIIVSIRVIKAVKREIAVEKKSTAIF